MTKGKLSKLIDKIKYKEDAPRNYIGASSIGDNCLRKIWYGFNGFKAEPVPARTRRIWQVGHILESFVIDLLKKAGIQFEDYQVELIDSELPYFKGHFDGLMVRPHAILEIKTAKDASFNLFIKHGLKKWNERYYAQIQSYMGMSGINMAYILVLNKDTSAFEDERVLFDAAYYEKLRDKARLIYEAVLPPPRINGNPLWYECKLCQFNKECHK